MSVNPARPLLDRPATVVDGYLDVMGDVRVPQTAAQRLMGSTVLPKIYERVWRPIAFWGFTLRNTSDEDRRKLELLDIHPGDTVLDVACGPGNTTRSLVGPVGADGLAVGVDSAATMLAQAVRDTPPGRIDYVRADAVDLPFPNGTFDSVSCYGALYLVDDPFGALREMIRVLTAGGRIAVLTTCARGPAPVRRASVTAASRLAPLRLFDVDEVTDVLRAGGLVDVKRYVSAASQTVSGRRAS